MPLSKLNGCKGIVFEGGSKIASVLKVRLDQVDDVVKQLLWLENNNYGFVLRS